MNVRKLATTSPKRTNDRREQADRDQHEQRAAQLVFLDRAGRGVITPTMVTATPRAAENDGEQPRRRARTERKAALPGQFGGRDQRQDRQHRPARGRRSSPAAPRTGMNPNAVTTPTKPIAMARTRGTVGLEMRRSCSRRISAASATKIPPRKLLVCPGAPELGPPPWDDVTPSDIKLPLSTPRAPALPRQLRTYGVVTTHQKRRKATATIYPSNWL